MSPRGLMNEIRLLALDIDGTLLTSTKAVSPRTRAAVAAALAAGVRLVLVTGRRHPAARHVAQDLALGLTLVLHNGALIVEDGAVLQCRPLARALACAAIGVGRRTGCAAVLHCGLRGEGRLLVEGVPAANELLARYLERSQPDLSVVARLEAAIETEDPLQVMFGGRIDEMQALRSRLELELGSAVRLERTLYPGSGVGIIDVLDAGVGKAQALRFLSARWGIAAAATVAVGDNWNDREMLEQVGVGLVMGNADPELLQLGFPVLPSNDEDGVAVAIENYVLKLGDAAPHHPTPPLASRE